MEISVSNVVINYFLLHNDNQLLPYAKLQELIKGIEQNFNVIITDNDKHGLTTVQQLCSDFLNIDDNYNLIQENILNYLEELQPIYEWFSFRQWERSQQYYEFIKNFE